MRHHASRLLAVDGLTPCQEAALLHAEGRADDAISILEQAVTDDPDGNGTWRLLFALYRACADAERFEALRRRYAARFGGSGPAWLHGDVLRQLPAEMQPGGDAHVELTAAFAKPGDDAMLHARCARYSVVHLDATRIRDIDHATARRLSALLHALADAETGVFISGAQRLIDRLHGLLTDDGEQVMHWRLVLDLYRLQDREQEFGRVALAFALQTGAEQPRWESSLLPIVHARPADEKRKAPRYGGPESLALTGVVVSPRDAQLSRLAHEAAQRTYVNVDLSNLSRIGPAAAQALVALTAASIEAGCTVRLLRPDPLIETLLTILSLPPRVELIRAQFT